MAMPIDGFAIYESVFVSQGSSVWLPRLQQIATAGFKVVINYSLLQGHATDMVAYINGAASVGLKVAVTLQDPRIWRDGTYSLYTSMYADAGNPGTGTAFMQYIVAQTSGLAGTWGWYIGDELVAADHTTFATYAAAVKTADSTHPRLIILNSDDPTNSFWNGTTAYWDSCEVGGDDYYPIGNTNIPSGSTVASIAGGIQAFDTSKGLQSAMVLQAFSASAYTPFPLLADAPWPTEAQMQQARNDALMNMAPRLLLWYSYFDVTTLGSPDFAPANQWSNLVNAAIYDRSGVVLFPPAVRRGTQQRYRDVILGDTPYAYYRLDDTGRLTVDATANALHGIQSATGITRTQPGALAGDSDTALLLDGASGSVSLPNAVSGSGWTTATFEVWFKLSTATPGGFSTLMQGDNTGINKSFQLFLSSNTTLSFGVGAGGANHLAVYTFTFQANVWYYATGVYDGTHAYLYLNGVLHSTSAALSGAIGSTSLIPRLGTTVTGGSPFPGWLDEAAFYRNSVLSADRILAHYNAGLGQGLHPTTYILLPAALRRQT